MTDDTALSAGSLRGSPGLLRRGSRAAGRSAHPGAGPLFLRDFTAGFGIHDDPYVYAVWRPRTLQDDPRTQTNSRGRVAFARGAEYLDEFPELDRIERAVIVEG